jgi:hypothetical protein
MAPLFSPLSPLLLFLIIFAGFRCFRPLMRQAAQHAMACAAFAAAAAQPLSRRHAFTRYFTPRVRDAHATLICHARRAIFASSSCRGAAHADGFSPGYFAIFAFDAGFRHYAPRHYACHTLSRCHYFRFRLRFLLHY